MEYTLHSHDQMLSLVILIVAYLVYYDA